MKEITIFIIVGVILISFVANEIFDENKEATFFAEMRASHEADRKAFEDFASKGNRNTAQQGYGLCLRIQHLEREHHKIKYESTCEEIYKVSN